jgi:hypothetical protein
VKLGVVLLTVGDDSGAETLSYRVVVDAIVAWGRRRGFVSGLTLTTGPARPMVESWRCVPRAV